MTKPTSPYQPYAAVHENPKGEGDARPTALQIVQDCGATGKLKGKTILITGCTAGIGIETARALYTTGAKLFLTARDMAKIETVITDITSSHPGLDSPRPEALELHLDSLAQVRAFASAFTSRTPAPRLDILIANAGVMASAFARTPEGFELQIGTNHLAHFLLIRLLRPLLVSSAATSADSTSRVILLSSAAHRRQGVRFDDPNWERDEAAYDRWAAYGQSKTANLYTAAALDRRGKAAGARLVALSVHPGGIKTELGRHLDDDDRARLNLAKFLPYYKSAAQGGGDDGVGGGGVAL